MSGAARSAPPAVLVLACRRPALTQRLLRFLVGQGVTDLHVVVDGPRDTPGDAQRVEETREVVRRFELPRERLWLRERNLGGPIGVPEAIDWFFASRERGVILEDDLLPDGSFLPFAAELLERYADEPRVAGIHGWSCVLEASPYSYHFSRYAPGWGWATWASRWKAFDREGRLWKDVDAERVLREASGGDPSFVHYWMTVFRRVYEGGRLNWDYRWLFVNFVQRWLTATASVNLVENSGFGEGASNTTAPLFFLLPVREMTFPLRHPPRVEADRRADLHTHRASFLQDRASRMRYRLARWRARLTGRGPAAPRR